MQTEVKNKMSSRVASHLDSTCMSESIYGFRGVECRITLSRLVYVYVCVCMIDIPKRICFYAGVGGGVILPRGRPLKSR